MYLYMYAYMYVCELIRGKCMLVCSYVIIRVCMYVYTYICVKHTGANLHAWMNARMHARKNMYAYMFVCISIHMFGPGLRTRCGIFKLRNVRMEGYDRHVHNVAHARQGCGTAQNIDGEVHCRNSLQTYLLPVHCQGHCLRKVSSLHIAQGG